MNVARYLIPIDSRLSAAEYAKNAETVLREMGVISSEDERFPSLFYRGNKSTEPFEKEPGDDEQGFESACIFSGPHFTLAPDEYVDGIRCPKCDAEITDQWADAMKDQEGYKREDDVSQVWVSCPKCGYTCRVHEVKPDTVAKFFLTDRYVCFWNARMPRAAWVAEFDRRLGCHHEVFEYGWT
jgi:hypothetical protein